MRKIKKIEKKTGNTIRIIEDNSLNVDACIDFSNWSDMTKLPKILHKKEIKTFKTKKMDNEGVTDEMFFDLNQELNLLDDRINRVHNKEEYFGKHARCFKRALAKYEEALLAIKDDLEGNYHYVGTEIIEEELKGLLTVRNEL